MSAQFESDGRRSAGSQTSHAEQVRIGTAGALTDRVARSLFKLMAYRDEYEVARLSWSPASTKASFDRCLEVVALPDMVRGYEEIKLQSVRRDRERLRTLGRVGEHADGVMRSIRGDHAASGGVPAGRSVGACCPSTPP